MSDYKNIFIQLESRGEVEIKYISLEDMVYIERLIEDDISDKDFLLKTLFHQFVEPKISFKDIKKLPDKILEQLAIAFVQNEIDTFEYYKDTGDFIKDFKQALVIGMQKNSDEFRKSIEPILKSAQNSLRTFNNDYASIIQQSLIGSSYIQESIKELSIAIKPITDSQNMIAAALKPFLEQYDSTARIITESLKPQIDIWQKWTEQYKDIFDGYTEYWDNFQKKYSVAETKAVVILQKYKWFITPSMPFTFVFNVLTIDKQKGRKDKEINKLFIKYFEENNWRNLGNMVSSWKNNPIFIERHKILIDCFNTVRVCSKHKINGVNVVLPTLITQIDGLISDYLISKDISWDCDYNDRTNPKTKKVSRGRISQIEKNKPVILTTQLDELAKDIFLNILFQKSQKGKPLATPFNFNRHKIIHGNIKRYGRKDYLIRAFMVLDLLAHF